MHKKLIIKKHALMELDGGVCGKNKKQRALWNPVQEKNSRKCVLHY